MILEFKPSFFSSESVSAMETVDLELASSNTFFECKAQQNITVKTMHVITTDYRVQAFGVNETFTGEGKM